MGSEIQGRRPKIKSRNFGRIYYKQIKFKEFLDNSNSQTNPSTE